MISTENVDQYHKAGQYTETDDGGFSLVKPTKTKSNVLNNYQPKPH